jgi:hypothetical protein
VVEELFGTVDNWVSGGKLGEGLGGEFYAALQFRYGLIPL